MQTKTLLFCIVAAMLSSASYAQPVIVKQRAVGAADRVFFTNVVKATDGGFVVAGSTNSGIGEDKTEPNRGVDGTDDYWIVKLDGAGNKQWDKTLGGNHEDQLNTICVTPDHGYILGGYSYSNVAGEKSEPNRDASLNTSDYWVIKVDSLGNKQWDKTIGGSGDDLLFAIDTTGDGGYILGGYSYSGISGDRTDTSYGSADYWIVKLDNAGHIVWNRTFGTFDEEYVHDIKHTKDGGYVVAGLLGLMKLDGAGNKIWSNNFLGRGIDKVIQTTDGSYVAGGSFVMTLAGNTPPGKQGQNYWLVQVDSLGNTVKDILLGGRRSDILSSLAQTNDGGLIVGGYSDSPVSGNKSEASRGSADYWVVKLRKSWKTQWDKTLGGSTYEQGGNVLENGPNRFVVGGNSSSGVSGDRNKLLKGPMDFWLVWLRYQVPADSAAAANLLVLDKLSTDAATTKLSVYPNPATEVLHVQYAGKAVFVLTSSSGTTVLSKTINGSGQLNVAHLPAGVYYLQNTATGDKYKVLIQ